MKVEQVETKLGVVVLIEEEEDKMRNFFLIQHEKIPMEGSLYNHSQC
jgi:hypothetical protein